MNNNEKLKAWIDLGVCRGTALARVLDCSRQYINKLTKMKSGLTDGQWNAVSYGISIVELDEAKSSHLIEQNILRAARLSHSKVVGVRQMAEIALDKWVGVLGAVA